MSKSIRIHALAPRYPPERVKRLEKTLHSPKVFPVPEYPKRVPQMDIQLRWRQPIPLRDGWQDDLIYTCDELADLPETPGIYVFGRSFGDSISPLYIGRASNLARRIQQQLNHARLMRRIEKALNGGRVLLVGELELRRGQQADRVLNVVEPALIEHALAQGHELINKHGTRIPVHRIHARGSRKARSVAPFALHRKKVA